MRMHKRVVTKNWHSLCQGVPSDRVSFSIHTFFYRKTSWQIQMTRTAMLYHVVFVSMFLCSRVHVLQCVKTDSSTSPQGPSRSDVSAAVTKTLKNTINTLPPATMSLSDYSSPRGHWTTTNLLALQLVCPTCLSAHHLWTDLLSSSFWETFLWT